MTKSSKTTAPDARAESEVRDALFTAHQVHTLAQLTYQRLAAGQAVANQPQPPSCFYWYA